VVRAALPAARGAAPVPEPHRLTQGAHRHTLTTSRAASLLQILGFAFFGPMATRSISNIQLWSKAPAAKGDCGGAKGRSGHEVAGMRCAPSLQEQKKLPERAGGGRG